MITSFNFVSAKGAEMPLLNNPYFNLTGIDGFTTVQSDIASITVPFVDGDTITNIQAQPRTVVLYLKLRETAKIETAKRYIFQYVKAKLQCTLQLQQDGRDIELVGVVEAIDLPRFEQGCTMAVTIHCSQPYWQDVDFVVAEISQIIDLHYFPEDQGGLAFPTEGVPFGAFDDDLTQELQNDGDVETGLVITIIALGDVTNPKIYNTQTGEYIGINDTLQGNDAVTITTIRGQKTITKNGVNIIDKIAPGSTFLQLSPGQNEFTIIADSGISNVYFTLTFKQLYV
ncbi:MAG: phage tail family protein [Prevotella sp.]|nr:phage tail family protein [Prevotella sp.]